MEHKHSVYDTDTHFVIAKDTREIKLESKATPVIVQHDHNSERFSFELPRFIDSHDMILCNEVQVHYLNIDASTKDTAKGVYKVEDIRLLEGDENTAVCSWLISENATQYAGKLNFMIRFACLADDDKVLYRWNTGIYTDLTVVSGYDNGEAVTEDFPDILAQWKAELFGIGDTEEQRIKDVSAAEQAAITAEGQKQIDAIAGKGAAVLDSIPDEYEALSARADHNRRNKAGAIVLNAQGESIMLNDASEYPVTGLKVFGKSEQIKTTGKNLWNNGAVVLGAPGLMTKTDTGFSFVRGTNTLGTYVSFNMSLYSGQTVTWSCSGSKYNPTLIIYSDKVYGTQITSGFSKITYTTTEDLENAVFAIIINSVDGDNVVSNIQIELGETATEYEPYSGGVASPSPEYPQEINSVENAVVSVCGKNLFNATAESKTVNGVTFTINEDKSVTIDGTATATVYFTLGKFTLNDGKYLLSGCTDGGANYVLYFQRTSNYTGYVQTTTKEIAFDIEDSDERTMLIAVYAGATVANKTLYPMIRHASVADSTYEPHKEPQTVTISHTLPGIPVSSDGNHTDANGQRWICDEVDLARGVYVQRVKRLTLDGTEDWHYSNYIYLDLDEYAAKGEKGFCSHFVYWYNYGGDCIFASERWLYLGSITTAKYDADTWKEFLAENNVTVYYVLATPIETALTDAEINVYKALCTNKPNTTILNDAGAYMAVEYVADTKTYIDNKIAELMAK